MDSNLRSIVKSAYPSIDTVSGNSVTNVITEKELTDDEIKELEEDIEGQYCVGWGGNPFDLSDCEISFVCFDKLKTIFEGGKN